MGQTDLVIRALAEAFDWAHPAWSTAGPALLRAQERLNVDLHHSIAQRVRSHFLLGEYELAAFPAMRQVGIRCGIWLARTRRILVSSK